MTDHWSFGLACFVSLFTVVDPPGVIPIFMSMTNDLSAKQSQRVARRAVLTAMGILIGFAISGEFVFRLFSITVNSLRVAGGVIFFMMGYEMLQAKLSRTQHTSEETERQFANDIAITPLGVPMICGPGAITSVILFMGQAESPIQQILVLLAIVLVMGLTWLSLVFGRRVLGFLGDSGNKVLMRLMGLIVMAIAVEFFFAGLTPLVQKMFPASQTAATQSAGVVPAGPAPAGH